MPALRACLAAAAGLTSVAHAAAAPKVVGFDIQKPRNRALSNLGRRDTTVSAPLANYRTLYEINVTVGTPPQQLGLQIDTGSSDLWFPYAGSRLCQTGGCESAFDPDASSTFEDVGRGEFKIGYVDGTEIEGDYMRDVLAIGDTEVRNMTMAVATNPDNTAQGIMGVGFIQGETLAQQADQTYPNVPVQLVNQGFINSVAYSLWLNDLSSNAGNILFGGVDKDKYMGDLIALPIQPDARTGALESFTVAMSSLNVKAGGGKSVYSQPNLDQAVILDSGTSLTLLPDDLANAILEGVGAQTQENIGSIVRCSLGTTGASLEFGFGGSDGPVIRVGMDEMVIPLYDTRGRAAHFRNGEAACLFGIEPAGDLPVLLGDTFMRSAYVVYDLHNNQVALANTQFNATSSDVQEITNSTIPGVSKTASGLTVTQTATGPIRASGGALSTSGASATADAGTGTWDLGSTNTASSSKGAAAGLAPPMMALETVVCGVVVMFSAMLGGSLLVSF